MAVRAGALDAGPAQQRDHRAGGGRRGERRAQVERQLGVAHQAGELGTENLGVTRLEQKPVRAVAQDERNAVGADELARRGADRLLPTGSRGRATK